MNAYRMHRTSKHIILACLSGIMVFSIYLLLDFSDGFFRFSLATGYAGLILISITLLIGPLNLIRKKPNPITTYLRRDIGIWAAIISLIHVIIGLQRHFSGRMWQYFIHEMSPGEPISIRFDAFGFANHSGLIATLICILLLSLSNNLSLKKIGPDKWKNMQRLNYLSFILIIVHGLIYQIITDRNIWFMILVMLVFIIVFAAQWRGYQLYIYKIKKMKKCN